MARLRGNVLSTFLLAILSTLSTHTTLLAQQPDRPNNDERVVLRLIPDQKAFLGAPDTTLNLKDVFQGTVIATENDDLKIELLRTCSKSIAKAEINDNNTLTLRWGTRTGKVDEIIVRATNKSGEYLETRFTVEVWQPDYLVLFFTVLGGLGIFLLGMKNLSEGIQAIAGNRLRRMIGAVTNNRLMATSVGILVTTLVQSSSITTVITVGFVNSSLLTLSQAIGVIMGANIGTTITGWVLVLKIGKYGLPIVGIAAFVYLFVRNERVRYLALTLMGLGMIFFGLDLMKNGFAVVKEIPEFEQWFHTFTADTYLGVLKCAMVGCILTFIVQSSSATLGITIGLAQIGVIPFETAAALVLGENIGTTITAWLASLGASRNAKRAAYFHVFFNVVGVAWITAVFPWYLMLIRHLAVGDAHATIGTDDATWAIAVTHTGFNVANTLVFIPFAGPIAALLVRLVPDTKAEEPATFTNLDVRMLESPVIGIEQSRLEVLRMAEICGEMMDDLRDMASGEQFDEERMQQILRREIQLDRVQREIVAFMNKLLGANVPHDIIDEARRQLRMADEYESVSDYILRIAKAHRKLHRAGLRLPYEESRHLQELHDMVASYLRAVTDAEEASSPEASRGTRELAKSISQHGKALASEFVARMANLDPVIDVAYNRQILGYRRVRDHILNAAEALAGEK